LIEIEHPPANEQEIPETILVAVGVFCIATGVEAQCVPVAEFPTNQRLGEADTATIGTPRFHVAVTIVAEFTTTVSAFTPPNDAWVDVYPEVKKFEPENTIVLPEIELLKIVGYAAIV
jgi:hypothetical protein